MENISADTQQPKQRKAYCPPLIEAELFLEARAGSPLRLPPDLLPGAPGGFEK